MRPGERACGGYRESLCGHGSHGSAAPGSCVAEYLNRTGAACTDAFRVGERLVPNHGVICGDGRIELGETCDDGNALSDDGIGPADPCLSNCRIESCVAAGTRTVTVSVPASQNLVGLSVLLDYKDAKVGIPGRGSGVPVQSRLFSNVFSMTPNDLNDTLRNTLLDPTFTRVAPGAASSVQFDACDGTDSLSAADFGCTVVEASSAELLPISASCSVSVQ